MKAYFLGASEKTIYSLFLGFCLLGSCFDFYDIAQGTGTWIGEFALTWVVLLLGYWLFSLVIFLGILRVIFQEDLYQYMLERIVAARIFLGRFRWFVAGLFFLFPIWLFQFSVWGIVFQGLFIRLLVWQFCVLAIGILISSDQTLIRWPVFLAVLVLSAAAFSMAASLKLVSSYPFSLGWSEGNRLWDYSIMFGRDRYDYPADKDIFVLLETGRQFVGAIPFLIPEISIRSVRLWLALLEIVPYVLLGLALFRSTSKQTMQWIILALWTWLFLRQGPIHPPLVLSAILVVLAWRRPYWISIPLILLAGYFTNISRFTWIFAPAMWIVMLEFCSASLETGNKIPKKIWIRTIVLSFFGLVGGVVLPELIKALPAAFSGGVSFLSIINTSQVAPGNLGEEISAQPLLWYRLLPNSTYGFGILPGLLAATAPLIVLLFYFIKNRRQATNIWQGLGIVLPLVAFMAVGLVASTKIGGGGDLHNMDMFLIGLLFSAAILWNQQDGLLPDQGQGSSIWLKVLLAIIILIPALNPLYNMRSYNYIQKAAWLVALTDAPNARALEMYPTSDTINHSLKTIQNEVDLAREQGDVLFVDQRQLLTFGFIKGVPLLPEYDKKVLIERSLGSSHSYFDQFYDELEQHRFSLIIIQPLNIPQKNSSDQFGEENNAWVKWVTIPLLCYYEVHLTLADVNVQLLTPRAKVVDCAGKLP